MGTRLRRGTRRWCRCFCTIELFWCKDLVSIAISCIHTLTLAAESGDTLAPDVLESEESREGNLINGASILEVA